MISLRQTLRSSSLFASLAVLAACGQSPSTSDSENAIIDPPAQCSPDRPDCSSSADFPVAADLNATNSAGLRYSDEAGSLVIDRVSSLPDSDGDGVPDDADDCPGTPDWVSCDNDPTNDGLYQTVFYDPTGSDEVVRRSIAATISDIPRIDVYFLIDATPTLAEEVVVLQGAILSIIDDVRLEFPDAQFGLGLYREYALDPLADPDSQSPYHHVLDLTDDELLVAAAVNTLNTVANNSPDSTAATQALFSVASGRGLADTVPNRGSCPNGAAADVGYPCFRPDALHLVMNISDSAVSNGPNPAGAVYGDPPFAPGVGAGVMTLPPVEMFPSLLLADDAATALELGDLSGTSLTLMGMSTLLSDAVDTILAPGCAPPPPMPGDPPGTDMDAKDVVLSLRFDSPVVGVDAFANNTHWPGANVALFDSALLDPLASLACDGPAASVANWGAINWAPATGQQYYLVADGVIPATDPGNMPEGAFSISIVHDGDPPNASWLTADAPALWADVEAALLASHVRVASVVTLKDAMDVVSPGAPDAREIALDSRARTKFNSPWVTELPAANGDGLDAAISNTIDLVRNSSVYNIRMSSVDDPATSQDETEFIVAIRHQGCAQGDPLDCSSGTGNLCLRCDVGAVLDYEVVFTNSSVSPTGVSQRFDFELLVEADGQVEVERIPVRVLVPDSASHQFGAAPGSNFYRNVYDSTARCITPPERPKWGDLDWSGSTPAGSSIEFQIRTANTAAELPSAVPAIVVIPTDTGSQTLNLSDELIADGQSNRLPFIQITAILNPSVSPPVTPTLEGWSFEFVCEAAE